MAETPTFNQTILFSDIADSTRLYDRLGDTQARNLIAAGIDLMSSVAKSAHGQVVKTIGDEVMCRFNKPDRAARAAICMQETICADAQMSAHNIQLRIGFHHGPVIEEINDIFGAAVNIAARMVSLAKAGQIVTTRLCLDNMSSDLVPLARLIDQTWIKGKHALFEIYELLWGQPQELTMVGTSTTGLRDTASFENAFLVLDLDEKHICVNHEQPIITLGRDASNRIVINNPKVSRLHARIEMRRAKFILVDQSTNGTFILPHGGHMIHLRREEIPLEGEGLISLGREAAPDGPMVIRYSTVL